MEIIATAEIDVTLNDGSVKKNEPFNVYRPKYINDYPEGVFVFLTFKNGEQYSGNFREVSDDNEIIISRSDSIGLPLHQLRYVMRPQEDFSL
ncbi:MAG: hypothetical protein SNJ31_07845 [Rikenellaceae bacterium]